MTRLAEIVAARKQDVNRLKLGCSLAEMARRAEDAPPSLDFLAGLARDESSGDGNPALIAEIKRASPSRGNLAPHLDPLETARRYQENGAAAISVLTEEHYFKGHLNDLRTVASGGLGLPLLRKDFIFDAWQVYEARQAGADAVLLIVACLESNQLRELQDLIQNLHMTALIEVHTLVELEIALACRPGLIGINNRNLSTFEVDLETTLRLRPFVPPGVVVVSESGIRSYEDVQLLRKARVDAILVGEALVTSADIGSELRLLASRRPG